MMHRHLNQRSPTPGLQTGASPVACWELGHAMEDGQCQSVPAQPAPPPSHLKRVPAHPSSKHHYSLPSLLSHYSSNELQRESGRTQRKGGKRAPSRVHKVRVSSIHRYCTPPAVVIGYTPQSLEVTHCKPPLPPIRGGVIFPRGQSLVPERLGTAALNNI